MPKAGVTRGIAQVFDDMGNPLVIPAPLQQVTQAEGICITPSSGLVFERTGEGRRKERPLGPVIEPDCSLDGKYMRRIVTEECLALATHPLFTSGPFQPKTLHFLKQIKGQATLRRCHFMKYDYDRRIKATRTVGRSSERLFDLDRESDQTGTVQG